MAGDRVFHKQNFQFKWMISNAWICIFLLRCVLIFVGES